VVGRRCAGGSAAPAGWAARIDEVVRQAASAGLGTPTTPRVEVAVGTLDPRLQLAPCEKVEVYLPAGHRAWGRTRAGVRCLSGPVRWNVFVPLTVRVLAPAVQAASALPAGTTLDASHLRVAEADWAAVDSAAFADPQALVGRTLQRALPAGAALRESDLQRRRWFAIGDIVRVVAAGPGYAVSGDGVALTPGIEGSPARVRTEGGRVVSGMPVGERRLAVQP
jgi:flagella basal body P-ring formation protein FlgA